MVAVIAILLAFGVLGLIIGNIIGIKTFKKEDDFSWLPIIFCGSGLLLFALAMVLQSCYVCLLQH